ncbi:phosphotransferase [Lentibacillus sp. N15]|uniref:phosphotransferase n=1 Tax=Lentibacillus songyuanensis TaxID=3136161 RepID=UPI0031BA518D
MNKFNQRDDMRIDRLSSFLYQKGGLDCKAIIPIKGHVFHLSTPDNTDYILKKYPNSKWVQQQWRFFDTLQSSVVVKFARFPNGRKYIKHNDFYWTIAPFVPGEKLHYSIERDRQTSVHTLRQFHRDAKTIRIHNPIKRQLFYVRWSNRLAAFKETKSHFVRHGFPTLFHDIVKTTESQLAFVSQLPWQKLEHKAEKKGEWVHGDVAGHNFIQDAKVHMIDFDLLACAPILYDYIQLGQRFLPYLEWDLDKLLAYQMVKEKELKLWINAMLVPTDVLREWLHFLRSNSTEAISRYLVRMENEWLRRQYFLNTAKLMLKSM